MMKNIIFIYFLLFLNIITTLNLSNHYSFGILSDIHIGDAEGEKAIDLLQAAVDTINSLVNEYNIKFVFITGDLSNSAMTWQYNDVKKVLDKLIPHYFPILGNHDVWQYNSTWEEKYPTGDTLFANTFKENLQHVYIYNDKIVWNPQENIYSWFQNWELRVGKISFIALDWNSRQHALSELGYKGAMPGAELYKFSGGTFPWLEERLSKISKDFKTIVFLQHHPFRAPWFVPDFIYGFSPEEKAEFRKMLLKYHPIEKYWGVLAGHWHRWFNGTAFDEWPTFMQWETEACKLSGGFSLITIKNDSIIDLKQMYAKYKK